MTRRQRLLVPFLLTLSLLGAAVFAFAADPALEQAKTLYASASFEDALAAISRVDAAESADPEVLLYKALCLLALGRPQEASVATRTLVSVTPLFTPDTTDLPPRFQTLWLDTRKTILPGVAREAFSSARVRYQAKEYAPALEQFQAVLSLTNDPTWKDSAEANDLRTLASGFMDLAQAAIPKPAPPAPEPVVVAAPPPPPPPAPVIIEPAVAIRQDMPRWSPPNRMIATQNFDGAVRVVIDETGRVTEATIVRPTHVSYDTMLLRAARSWTYRPATRNGQPIASEKVVDVHLAGTQ